MDEQNGQDTELRKELKHEAITKSPEGEPGFTWCGKTHGVVILSIDSHAAARDRQKLDEKNQIPILSS